MSQSLSLVWSSSDSGVFGAEENMQRDTELASRAEEGEGAWRLYTWLRPSVSLGRFQSAERALLPGADALVEVVQRPTGGKAVLHGHDLTLGVALPLELFGLTGTRDVARVYRLLIEPIVLALQSCGAEVELAERTRWVRSAGHVADCFAHIAPNDVINPQTGQKVVGCALRLTERAVLLQASLPQGEPRVDPRLIFARPNLVPGIQVEAERFQWELASAFGVLDQSKGCTV